MKNVSLPKNSTLSLLQEITCSIYGEPNDRFFNTSEIISNKQKFLMRAIKGIRKNDIKKIKLNLAITTGWYLSLLNRLHIDLEKIIWQRFPRLCSYCGKGPCACRITKPKDRPKNLIRTNKKPNTLSEFQQMFEEIYPANTRTLEHAGIHLAEEDGELSESIHSFLGSHSIKYFKSIEEEAADYFSCLMGVFNSAGIDFETEMLKFYKNNCHSCGQSPCICNFKKISDFRS